MGNILDQTLDAYIKCNRNSAAAARMLGIPDTTFKSRLNKVRQNDQALPDGQKLKGVSTYYDAGGLKRMQWVKTTADLERQLAMIREAAAAFKGDIGREKKTASPKGCLADLLSCYILTDYHLGQMSWAEEAGEDWGTDKAEDMLFRWFAAAIDAAPKSKTAVLAQLGDFLHFDGLDPVTPTSKHVLDADARFAKIVHVAVRAMRRIIRMLLEKHETVHILVVEGNHDLSSSVWLRELLADRYENEPRVIVDGGKTPYHALEHGKTSLFFHHGHKRRLDELSKTFAGLYRGIFGRTKYSYAHMGHLHHVASKEDGLMTVEQHPTMAVKDAHSARMGHVSNRGASVITYSKEHGEVSRATIRPEMIR